jgi:phosphate transport system substrate-binding protein
MSMGRRVPALVFLGAFLAIAILSAHGQEDQKGQPAGHVDVRIVGPVSTKPLIAGLARAVAQASGIQIGGRFSLTNAGTLDALAQGDADLVLLTKPLTGEERADYPDLDLVVIPIGMEVVALGVSADLWNAGVHAISPATMREIYEQKITNWKAVGGPDEKIMLFNFAEGGGVWEVFAQWLYGDNRKAPIPKVQSAANSEDARDDLEFTPGGIVPIGAGFVDGSRCHALGLDLPGGIVAPTSEAVAANRYPIVRPIIAVVIGRPTLGIRAVTDYLTSPAGQALVKKTGALGLDAVPQAPKPDY